MSAKGDEMEEDRWFKAKDDAAILSEFFDWLRTQYVLCWPRPRVPDKYAPASINPEKLLAEYFSIDLKAVERHRRRLLKSLQKQEEDDNGDT